MYQLYVQSITKGWYSKPAYISDNLDDLDLIAEQIDAKECCEYMIIEHRKDGDRTIRRQELYDECEVEYSDDVKTSFEIKATTFKVSRTKKKEELRKMTEEYLKE